MENKNISFVDIDTQVDFMLPGGALYVNGAEKLIPKIKEIVSLAFKKGIKILSSIDTHTENDPEFKDFPPHCIKGTKGWEKIKESLHEKYIVVPLKKVKEIDLNYQQLLFEKNKFSIFSNENSKDVLNALGIKKVFLYGVATEFCVRASSLDFLKNGFEIFLIEDLIKGVNSENSQKILKELKSAGIKFIKTEEIMEIL